MKTIFLLLAGLTISAVIVIGTIQLIKLFVREMVDMVHEAWHSPEHH